MEIATKFWTVRRMVVATLFSIMLVLLTIASPHLFAASAGPRDSHSPGVVTATDRERAQTAMTTVSATAVTATERAPTATATISTGAAPRIPASTPQRGRAERADNEVGVLPGSPLVLDRSGQLVDLVEPPAREVADRQREHCNRRNRVPGSSSRRGPVLGQQSTAVADLAGPQIRGLSDSSSDSPNIQPSAEV